VAITTDIRDRLVALQRSITVNGETMSASEYVSLGIGQFDLPLFVNFPLGSVRVQTAGTFFTITRNWNMRCYGSTAPTKVRPDQTEEWMYDIIDATYAFFLPKQRLELNGAPLDFVELALLTGDSGIQIMTYPQDDQSVNYYTVTFNLQVSYQSHCID